MKYLTEKVSFNEAKLLKDAGYPQDFRGASDAYAGDGSSYNIYHRNNYVAAPSYAQVFDWLLEKGYIVLIAPRISPVAYRPGDKIPGWQGWVNAEILSDAETWNLAAGNAIINVLAKIAK